VSGQKGERLEGVVRDVVQSGEAVVETARGLVFARGGLPGERVLVSLDGKPGRTLRGRMVSVLAASAERVPSPCAHVLRCGGCPFMAASPTLQSELKKRFLHSALVKAGAPESLAVTLHAAPHALHYRRRARMHFRVAGVSVAGARPPSRSAVSAGVRELGYVRERSHDVVDVSECVVLLPALDAAQRALREHLLPELTGEGEVQLALGKDARAVAIVRTEQALPSAAYTACERMIAEGLLVGVALYSGGATAPARFGDPEEHALGVDGAPLAGTLGGFSQAYAEVNALLAARAAELSATEGAKVLELYAGHGNLTVLLARGAASYTAVEQDAAAAEALRRNLAARALKAKVVTGDALAHVGSGALDVLVLDPPRSGAPGVLAAAVGRKPKRIVYVSCDPATLARDAREALSAGYRIEAAEGFDMFPQTADLESVLLLVR
jgi:23S rRNA (uracil1939-C5)-methyltransferase